MINRNDTILILGDTGDVGSRVKAILLACGFKNIISGHDFEGARSFNICDKQNIQKSIYALNPDIVIFAARHSKEDKYYRQEICNHLMVMNVIQACIFAQTKMCVFIESLDESKVSSIFEDLFESANEDTENKCKFAEISIADLPMAFLTY